MTSLNGRRTRYAFSSHDSHTVRPAHLLDRYCGVASASTVIYQDTKTSLNHGGKSAESSAAFDTRRLSQFVPFFSHRNYIQLRLPEREDRRRCLVGRRHRTAGPMNRVCGRHARCRVLPSSDRSRAGASPTSGGFCRVAVGGPVTFQPARVSRALAVFRPASFVAGTTGGIARSRPLGRLSEFITAFPLFSLLLVGARR